MNEIRHNRSRSRAQIAPICCYTSRRPAASRFEDRSGVAVVTNFVHAQFDHFGCIHVGVQPRGLLVAVSVSSPSRVCPWGGFWGTGLRMVFVLRYLWRFSRGCLLFGKQWVLGFLKCSGKLCSPPAVVVELAFCEL